MDTATATRPDARAAAGLDYDTIIIGAGLSGMYQLYRLRNQGQKVRVFEMGTGVGGTWYWNRYPGCRFDSESYSYGYSWSEEVLKEWDWTEHFAPQPETERYCNFVADKFDLRRDIKFETKVVSCRYDEAANLWTVTTDKGDSITCHYLVTTVGCLSVPKDPEFEGLENFKGQWVQTGAWPKEGVDWAGKNVLVIGTGSSAIQTIPEVAKTAGHLTVFQRTANYSVPAYNGPLPEHRRAEV
ncbi:MAG: NAD(P)/FAD-dependent oxidoreductase, partial [Alphaproteobacteria bacterium]|nr:NAD(P)/FAD-dependent oxidoreductase [Alphaproteobacteria bacterium]